MGGAAARAAAPGVASLPPPPPPVPRLLIGFSARTPPPPSAPLSPPPPSPGLFTPRGSHPDHLQPAQPPSLPPAPPKPIWAPQPLPAHLHPWIPLRWGGVRGSHTEPRFSGWGCSQPCPQHRGTTVSSRKQGTGWGEQVPESAPGGSPSGAGVGVAIPSPHLIPGAICTQ